MQDILPRVATGPQLIADTIERHSGPVWLEVGFGGGEHLAWQAQHNPDVLLIGAEPFLNGVAKLMAQVEALNLTNVAVHHGDVRPLMAAMQDGSLERLFVLHPDPWPKSRHNKRRMISPSFLAEAKRLMVPGGELRVSSDVPDYVEWTLMQAQIHARTSHAFEWLAAEPDDWRERPSDWPETRYEKKGRAAGRPPAYLRFLRTA
jgi:tRNA (guanine-N7-)-methyltransferase